MHSRVLFASFLLPFWPAMAEEECVCDADDPKEFKSCCPGADANGTAMVCMGDPTVKLQGPVWTACKAMPGYKDPENVTKEEYIEARRCACNWGGQVLGCLTMGQNAALCALDSHCAYVGAVDHFRSLDQLTEKTANNLRVLFTYCDMDIGAPANQNGWWPQQAGNVDCNPPSASAPEGLVVNEQRTLCMNQHATNLAATCGESSTDGYNECMCPIMDKVWECMITGAEVCSVTAEVWDKMVLPTDANFVVQDGDWIAACGVSFTQRYTPVGEDDPESGPEGGGDGTPTPAPTPAPTSAPDSSGAGSIAFVGAVMSAWLH